MVEGKLPKVDPAFVDDGVTRNDSHGVFGPGLAFINGRLKNMLPGAAGNLAGGVVNS